MLIDPLMTFLQLIHFEFSSVLRSVLFSTLAEKSLEFDEIEEVKAASATAGKDGTEEEASSRPTRRRRRDGMYIFHSSFSNLSPYVLSNNATRAHFELSKRQSL